MSIWLNTESPQSHTVFDRLSDSCFDSMLVKNRLALVEPVYEKGITFLAPRLVAQISHQEWTADMKLRQPVFLGLRKDKRPREVRMPENQV